MDFKIGQRVLVHQSPGMKCVDGRWIDIPHDCADPKQHWESRVIDWSSYHNCPMIGTPGNPNHAEWPYFADGLTLLEGEDWVIRANTTRTTRFSSNGKMRTTSITKMERS